MTTFHGLVPRRGISETIVMLAATCQEEGALGVWSGDAWGLDGGTMN